MHVVDYYPPAQALVRLGLARGDESQRLSITEAGIAEHERRPMRDDIQYDPIRWHNNTEKPRFGSRVTWIGVGSPAQVDGRYDGQAWYRDDGKPAITDSDQIVQWRYRREVAKCQ